MLRLVFATLGIASVTVASIAAADALKGADTSVIEVEVSLSELQECRETLSEVAGMPAVADNGTPLFFGTEDDLPDVRCVATEI